MKYAKCEECGEVAPMGNDKKICEPCEEMYEEIELFKEKGVNYILEYGPNSF